MRWLLREFRTVADPTSSTVHLMVAPTDSAAEAPPPTTQPAAAADADAQLARVIPELELRGVTLEQAFERLRDLTRANIVVQWRALESAGLKRGDVVKLRLWDVTLARALPVLLAAASDDSDMFGYAGADGIITVTTKDRLGGYHPTRTYNVRDLILRMRRNDESLYGTLPKQTSDKTVDEYIEELGTIVRDTVDADSWRDNGGSVGALRYWAGRLIVTQTPANQRQVEGLLDQLRADLDQPVRGPATRPAGAAPRPAGRDGE